MKFIFTLFLFFLINFTSSNIYCQSREDLRRELLNVYRDLEKQIDDEIDLLVLTINESLNEIKYLRENAKRIESEADSMDQKNNNTIDKINTDLDSLVLDTNKNINQLRLMGNQLINYSDSLRIITDYNIEESRKRIKDINFQKKYFYNQKKIESKKILDNAKKLNENIKKDSDISNLKEHLNFIKDRIQELEDD